MIRMVPAQRPFQSDVAASAVAMELDSNAVGSRAMETANETAPYQRTAIKSDNTSNQPIRRGGKLISSADCGSTSNPTIIAGTMMSTVSIPVAGIAIGGSVLARLPKFTAPRSNKMPAPSTVAVITLWTRAAARIPMTLIHVITRAAAMPMATKPTDTGAPNTVHRVPRRMDGNKYSIAVGKATDSNTHTVAYAMSNAQVQIKDQPGPSAARV